MWASYLSALLKGRALEVFVRLSRDDQSDYGQIKEALLTNFDLTERSFRKKFRDCRPEKAQTFRQFSGRLASYLDKWLGLAKVEKTYEAVCDFLARDQFLDCCSHELYLYLKPKSGIEAVIITVGISQLPVGIPIGTIIMIKSTIRSTLVK